MKSEKQSKEIMSVELLYIKWPIVKGENVKGLFQKASVDELMKLLNASDIDNCIIEVPTKNASNYPNKINSTELKNFFISHAGSKVFSFLINSQKIAL